jgi:RNA polymerase sigma-70 factor (ECF subfamily)
MTSFHDLYSRYARDVYRFAFYLTANPTLADDVTSETFVRVWTSPQPLRLATVKAYLLTIARNLCLMEARRTNRERELDEALPDARNLAADAEKKDETPPRPPVIAGASRNRPHRSADARRAGTFL